MCWTQPPPTTTSSCAAFRPNATRAFGSKTCPRSPASRTNRSTRSRPACRSSTRASVDENEWVAIALANNPNVLASRQAQIAAERDLRARQAGHLPTIDAIASYNEDVNHYNQLAGGQGFLGDQTNTRVLRTAAADADLSGRLHAVESARSARASAPIGRAAAQQRMDRQPRHPQPAAHRHDRRDPGAGAHQIDQVERVGTRSDADRIRSGHAQHRRRAAGATTPLSRRSSTTPTRATTTCAT